MMIHQEKMIVSSLVISGPAEKAGFSIYDEIVAINNSDISNVPPCDKKSVFLSNIQTNTRNDITLKRGEQLLRKSIELH
jgi:C-terminal processing protease CtpA/Prc